MTIVHDVARNALSPISVVDVPSFFWHHDWQDRAPAFFVWPRYYGWHRLRRRAAEVTPWLAPEAAPWMHAWPLSIRLVGRLEPWPRVVPRRTLPERVNAP